MHLSSTKAKDLTAAADLIDVASLCASGNLAVGELIRISLKISCVASSSLLTTIT